MAYVLTLPQAAALLGVTREGVWKMVKTGRLPATRVGHVWLVSRFDVEARASR